MIFGRLLNPKQKIIFGPLSNLVQNMTKRGVNWRKDLPKAWIYVCMSNRCQSRRESPENDEASPEKCSTRRKKREEWKRIVTHRSDSRLTYPRRREVRETKMLKLLEREGRNEWVWEWKRNKNGGGGVKMTSWINEGEGGPCFSNEERDKGVFGWHFLLMICITYTGNYHNVLF